MMNKSLVATALFIIAAGAGLSSSDYGKLSTERVLGSSLISGSFTMISHDSSANKVTVAHSEDVYLLDKRGRFVGAFDLERPPQEAARELESYL